VSRPQDLATFVYAVTPVNDKTSLVLGLKLAIHLAYAVRMRE